eukprot:1356369-Pyramimonas_sp.AAC.1
MCRVRPFLRPMRHSFWAPRLLACASHRHYMRPRGCWGCASRRSFSFRAVLNPSGERFVSSSCG